MNSTPKMDDIQWNMLIHNVSQNFDDLTIKRGFQYFKQGRVHQFMMHDAEHIVAVVKGHENYSVDLHLDSFSLHRCTCPVPANCKHMIAALLEYANLQDRPVHALVNAHSTAIFKHIVKPTPHAVSNRSPIQTVNRKAEATAKLKGQASILPTLSISEWHGLFEQSIAPLGMRIPNAQYAQSALEAIYTIKPQLSNAMELLFGFNAHLFVLSKLIKPTPQQGQLSNFFMGFYTQVAADDIKESIEHIFTNELSLQDEPEHWHHMTDSLTFLRMQMLSDNQNFQYFLDVYHQIWLNWIHPNVNGEEIYLEELQHLQSSKDELGTSISKFPWMLAQSLMHFYLNQDQQAWTILRDTDTAFIVHPEHLLPFLNILFKTEQWLRLKDWLVEIGPMLSNYRNHNLNAYWIYWETLIQHLPEAEEHMWSTLVSMLPHSRYIYEDKLLSHGKWRLWMDYQLSTGKDPLDFRVTVFQPIEKNSPELLLPFYHQAVERYVNQRNRENYKLAVKLLKRLSKLYKKTKQEARWELFIAAFVTRHSRLRALQEELRKGKLIS